MTADLTPLPPLPRAADRALERLEATHPEAIAAIDCDWCGRPIAATAADPIYVSRDGQSTVCSACTSNREF